VAFYLRKSIRVGPMRVNLSRSGIGVSAGIPGLRFGTGPRGSYVRMGQGHVTYRSTGRTPGTISRRQHVPVPASGPTPFAFQQSPGEVVLSDVTGADTIALVPAEPSELVAQLNAAVKTHRLWPWALAVTLVALFVLPWLLIVGVPLTVYLWWRDKVRRTVVAFYEVDGPAHQAYQRLVDTMAAAGECRGAWHIVASGDVTTTYQYKVNAGASALVSRVALGRTLAGPPQMSTNIAVPTFRSGHRSVYLLPDRALVKDHGNYADIPYDQLGIGAHEQRFIENETVPSDATVVGHTWKYVNKKGGPDRRFKDNPQLPIVLYGRLSLQSPGGFNAIWDFSRSGSANALATAMSGMRTLRAV
jgi:Protein of unknown function (DUF4236)